MTSPVVRRRVVLHGQVQGVGFRWNARTEATRLGVSGWVRNLPDGSVEAEIEGDRTSVDDMVEWLRRGPPFAEVSDVDVAEINPTGSDGSFEIRGI